MSEAKASYYTGNYHAVPTQALSQYIKYQLEHAPYSYIEMQGLNAAQKSGDVYMEVYVQPDGHVCVLSVRDYSNNDRRKKDLIRWIVATDPWKLPQKEGKPQAGITVLKIEFRREWFGAGIADPADVVEHTQNKELLAHVRLVPQAGYDLKKYLNKHTDYPAAAHTKGSVSVKVHITADGVVDSATVVKGLGNGCDEEAVRVLKEMPQWKPVKWNPDPAGYDFTLTVPFGEDE